MFENSAKVNRRALFGAVLVAVAGPASLIAASSGAASAATASPKVRPAIVAPRTNVFCAEAVAAEKNSTVSSASLTSMSSLEALYKKLLAEEPAILKIAPSQVKGDFQELFTYANGFYAELAKYKWNFTKVPASYFKSLSTSVSEKKLVAASTAISAYMSKTCGIKPKTT